MTHAASSRGQERDPIYTEYNVRPWGAGDLLYNVDLYTNHPKDCQFRLCGGEGGKQMLRGSSQRLGSEPHSIRKLTFSGT